VEWWGSITGVTNRHVTISYGTDGNQLVDNTATDWGNGPDEQKAVQFWRDPLVASTSPANGATLPAPASVTVAFSRAIQPQTGADFSGSVAVSANGAPVAGTVSPLSGSTTNLTWTPAAPLAPGSYTVTVFNLRSDIGGDSVPMQAPYVFIFTVTP
jgi:methionine-rich copper-binding protein CopC